MYRSAPLLIVCLLSLVPAAQARHHHRKALPSSPGMEPKGTPGAMAAAGAADTGKDAAGQAWWPPTATPGPAKIKLAGQATVDLPEGYVFFGKDDTRVLLEKMGNPAAEHDIGTIVPKDVQQKGFFVSVKWDAAGYIKDDEADKLDQAALLDSIREGTEAANEFRKQRGFKPLTVVGWDEPPRYERAAHHIVWAIVGKTDEGQTVNFNTRLLGRRGFLSLNLVSDPAQLAALKPAMQDLLSRTTFDPGNRYADFKSGTDKVSELGLAALIVGGAAVAGKTALKVGLLAKFGKLIIAALLALKKAVILLFVGIGAFFKRLFGKGKKAEG